VRREADNAARGRGQDYRVPGVIDDANFPSGGRWQSAGQTHENADDGNWATQPAPTAVHINPRRRRITNINRK
jgi:hypothetical protein